MQSLIRSWFATFYFLFFISHITFAAEYSELYIFGDSLSDTGLVYQAVGEPPTPPYYQGRFSDGPIWAEYFAPQIGLTFNPATNFAWGGAHTSDKNNVDRDYPDATMGLAEEIQQYLDTTEAADSEALYVVWAGVNDFNFLKPITLGEPITIDEIKTTVHNLIDAVTKLYNHGARHILVPNLPDVGTAPFVVAAGLEAESTAIIQRLNRYLKTRLDLLPFPVMYFDSFTAMKNPESYGVTVLAPACLDETVSPPIPCDNPEQYYFWDLIHPTTVTHRKIGDEMAAFINQDVEPITDACGEQTCHCDWLLDQQGFYNVVLTPNSAETNEGMIGLSINQDKNLNGFHAGTVVAAQGQLPSFLAFSLLQDSSVDLYLYDYLKKVAQLDLRLYTNSEIRNLVWQQVVNVSNEPFTSDILPVGNYILEIRTLDTAPNTYFGISVLATSIAGQINMGGLLNPKIGETFIAFYAGSDEIGITPYFAQSYGEFGASQPSISFRLIEGDTTQVLFETD
ncbi:SGNH/GDSL hydrolase family protein [Candidatus Albibeggiatoa sp. nov. NOAA]|uniref:SGNH/GDSL hydrolase family protein n=1 Tax=Candidatus Albibeggiatoa sp. nov. NOAA TaxID=3162724 RepID=UPI0032F6A8AD|nr:SGNH/GDSL hydrolase family protein [Thiotrichaceae bacterium]